MIGFVLLQRDIMGWEWYQHPTVSRLYIHLILKVNFTEKKWQGRTVKRGQLITSVNSLSSELKLSIQQIRSALFKLEEGKFIRKHSTNNFTLITLVNYDKFQSAGSTVNKRDNNRRTMEEQTNNKRITTTKQGNKEKKVNKETIELRKEKFKKQVFENSHYSNEILNSFFNYWAELDENTQKMRFEGERYFEISKRIDKWVKNERKMNFGLIEKEERKISTNR